METAGGGWTLVASVSGSDGSAWLPRPNGSDPTDLQRQPGVPPLFEAQHYLLGDPDPTVDADFRSWALFEAAGDGRGAGDQLLVTLSNASAPAPRPLLQTETCLGAAPLAAHLAGLAWNCSARPLLNLNRSQASEDAPLPGPDPCTHACAIVADDGWAAQGGAGGDVALLGGAARAFLLLKAGAAGGPDAAGPDADFAFLSTELRDTAGRGRGLGVLCTGSGCG
eukprot:1589976-Rhodomonas_salina.1